MISQQDEEIKMKQSQLSDIQNKGGLVMNQDILQTNKFAGQRKAIIDEMNKNREVFHKNFE